MSRGDNGGSSRTLEKELVFEDGVIIPKGYHVGVSFWLIHRSEKYFPKPNEFRPDRWVNDNSRHHDYIPTTSGDDTIPAGNRDAFFAFSGGARSCPGQKYAMKEATIAFAWLIKDIQFCIDLKFKLEIEWKAVIQTPKNGIPATISLRQANIGMD